MAGKIQKPYGQLQFRRGRRRNLIVLPPLSPVEGGKTERERAIAAATSHFGRIAGQDPAERAERPAEEAPKPKRKRRYAPRGERTPNPAKAARAAARPRDEKGHFIKRERPQRGTA